MLQLLSTVLECQICYPCVQRFVFGREASNFLPPRSNYSKTNVALEELHLSSSLVQILPDWDFFPQEPPGDCYLREAIQKYVRHCVQKTQMHREGSWCLENVNYDTTQSGACLVDEKEKKTWNDLHLMYSIAIGSLCQSTHSFLHYVIERVKGLHDSSVEENIALSGVVSNMVLEATVTDTGSCSWINCMLLLFLFHKEEPSSLYSAISLAWHEGMDRYANVLMPLQIVIIRALG